MLEVYIKRKYHLAMHMPFGKKTTTLLRRIDKHKTNKLLGSEKIQANTDKEKITRTRGQHIGIKIS